MVKGQTETDSIVFHGRIVNELDFRSSDWKLIFIGCTFFLVMIGLTLLFI